MHRQTNTQEQRATVLIADPLAPEAEEALAAAPDVEVRRVAGKRRAELLKAVPKADALIVRSGTTVDREVIAAAGRLTVVGRAGVGIDNIDVTAASERGVLVVNTPSANVHSACEHTIALMLACARCIPAANASTHRGGWERGRFQGVEIFGKTVGIIGFGRVGQLVAERMRAFGARVIATDPMPDEAAARRLGVRIVSLGELIAASDFVTIHTPKTPETEGMIDASALGGAKPGQILINAARGGVVDEQALADALVDGPLRAAGIDVFADEPPADSPLLGLENAVLTPHLGASTSEAQARAGLEIVAAVFAALRGEEVPGCVNGRAVRGGAG